MVTWHKKKSPQDEVCLLEATCFAGRLLYPPHTHALYPAPILPATITCLPSSPPRRLASPPQILEKNGWEVKYLRYSDLLLVEERLRPYFIAEFLKNLGCRAVKEVAAPGDKAKAAGAASGAPGGGDGARGRRGGDDAGASEEAREASIVMNDPKVSGPGRAGSSRGSSRGGGR